MNKAKLARKVEHALKDAGHRKSVIKGMGWKGHGTLHRRSGFMVATKGHAGVAVWFYSKEDECNLLPIAMLAKAPTLRAGATIERIRSQRGEKLIEYKPALRKFHIVDKVGEFGLPYILVDGDDAEKGEG